MERTGPWGEKLSKFSGEATDPEPNSPASSRLSFLTGTIQYPVQSCVRVSDGGWGVQAMAHVNRPVTGLARVTGGARATAVGVVLAVIHTGAATARLQMQRLG